MMRGGEEMRKIEIDDAIRSRAGDYKTKVVARCTDVVDDLRELGAFVSANNLWNDKSAIIDYINLLIGDYPAVLTLEPKDWGAYIKKYDKVQKREPNMLTKTVAYAKNGKGQFYKATLYERIICCLRYDEARKILGGIHQQMGLKTCVYCNVLPTLSSDGDVLYQMDHYLPQSKYPFLGTCFYNLQPSCGVCNGHKGTKDSDFGLYVNAEQHKVLSPFLFIPQVSNGHGAYPTCSEIKFTGEAKHVTRESEAHEEMFHLKNMYACCTGEVDKLYEDAYKVNDSAVQAMSACYGLNSTKADVVAYMSSHLSLDEKDIHKEPLTKLRQDTIKQMKEGGVV